MRTYVANSRVESAHRPKWFSYRADIPAGTAGEVAEVFESGWGCRPSVRQRAGVDRGERGGQAGEIDSIENPKAPKRNRVSVVCRSRDLTKVEGLTMELSFRQSHGSKTFLKGVSKLQGPTKPDT